MRFRIPVLACGVLATLFFATSFRVADAQAEEAPSKPKLQGRDELRNWKLEDPFDLSGELPKKEEIRKAVATGLAYILEQQREDGSWDVELTGQILSNTADDAVDSVCATSMACMALRDFAYLNPTVVEPAIKRGAEYVMGRILGGKLSTKVWYAIWRYSFGIRFLMGEYRHARDPEYREHLFSVCRRMMDSILSMQKTNKEYEEYLKLLRRDKTETPARSGIVLAPSAGKISDLGALVIRVEEGSAAAEAGIQPGDRIVGIEKRKVASAYDFHVAEEDFVEDETVKLVVRKRGKEEAEDVKMKLQTRWPADIGLRLREEPEGLVVVGFWPGSTSKEEGVLVNDRLLEIDREEVKTLADVDRVLGEVKIGRKIGLKMLREGKKKTARVETTPRRPGWLGVWTDDEDKGTDSGALIARVQRNSMAARAGIIRGDRITKFNGVPISGADHFNALFATYWEGQSVKFTVLRYVEPEPPEGEKPAEGKESEEEPGEEEEKKAEEPGETPAGEEEPKPEVKLEPKFFEHEIRLSAYLQRGELQITTKRGQNRRRNQIFVASVLKNGAADTRNGLKVDDRIISINGVDAGNGRQLQQAMSRIFVGDTVKIIVERSGRERECEVVAAAKAPEKNIEEGGWAYYFKNYAPSFVTAAVILNFEEFNNTFGKISRKYDLKRKRAMKLAAEALKDLRVYDKEHKVHSYVYDIRGVENTGWIDIRGNVGRIMVGELASYTAGKISKSALKKSLTHFLEFREELDRVRNYPHTHYGKRFNNAAYYWLFGHYYAAQTANVLGGRYQEETHETICKAVMLKRNEDGTWYGHKGFGKLCGTAHALIILGQLRDMEWAEYKPAPEEGPITPGGKKKDSK